MSAESSRTVAHVLENWAATKPDDLAYTFIESDGTRESLNYRQLWSQAARVARVLQANGDVGDRVVLLLPGGASFVVSFLGCMLARRSAVPTPPPRNERAFQRTMRIIDDSRANTVLVMQGAKSRLEAMGLRGDHLRIEELSSDLWGAEQELEFRVLTKPDDVALLQYTSGSTSLPKGVVVKHRNLYDNLEHLRVRFGYHSDSRLVSWLPIYHDMGLMGGMLAPFFAGVPGAIMLPQDFIMKPLRWLELMSSFGGTVSGGPNFAYDICVSRIDDRDVQSLDLSVWDAALNGAEPIRASTIDRFSAKFEPAGFRKSAFLSCYGLAESTLLVACTGLHDAPKVVSIDEKSLGEGNALEKGGAGARCIVSCGRVVDNHELEIVDPSSGRPLPDKSVGEIVVAGPSVCATYWTKGTEIPTSDDCAGRQFLRTGDLGFRLNGELFVTGRLKNTVIIRGLNLSCEGVEELAQSAHPTLYSCLSAALAIDDGRGERLVVLQEAPADARGSAEEIIGNIREAVTAHHGVSVDDVVLVATRSLPRTTSGKVRRAEALKRYKTDGLSRLV